MQALKKTNSNHFDWDFTEIYDFLELSNKYRTWKLLRKIHQQSKERLLVCEDFKEVMAYNEKSGGKRKANNFLTEFLNTTTHSELADLGFERPKSIFKISYRYRSIQPEFWLLAVGMYR